MASAFFSAPTFQGLKPLNKPTDSYFLSSIPSYVKLTVAGKRRSWGGDVKAKLNPSLFLGRFVFFNVQKENVAKQGLSEQNDMTHFKAGDSRANKYVSLLKSNDPVEFNIVPLAMATNI